MNTRRCELCGTLHGNRSGGVSISVPRADVDYCTHDHYNLCEACSLKVYDAVEKLKNSDGKNPKQSELIDIVQNQNAELSKIRMCLRNANDILFRALKFTNKSSDCQKMAQQIESAIDWLGKTEPYNADE